jgi:hypothetical protein
MKKNNTTEKSVLNAEKLSQALKEGTEKTLQNIIKEAIDNIILENEETEVDEPIVEDVEEKDAVADDSFEAEDVESVEEPKDTEEDAEEADEEAPVEGDEDEWSAFDEFKTDENDYDFTGDGVDAGEKLIKIFDMIEDGDEVIVTKNGNELEVSNEATGESEVIELDLDNTADEESEDADDEEETETPEENEFEIEIESDDEEETETPEENEFEIEIESEDELEESTNLGYTDSYQKKTAMTTPSNKEVANSKDTYSMDDVPEGDGKRWAGKGDMKPFDTVCEETDAELEEATNVGGAVQQRSTSKSHVPAGRKQYVPKGTKHASFGSEYKEVVENIKKENEALKEGIKSLKKSIKEAAVLNVNLGRIVNLLVNETTTREEKKSILNRFSKVTTINEGAALYETIKGELNESKKSSLNIDTAMVAETKKSLNETTIYQDRTSNPSLNLMDRMDRLFGKK